jgi:MFS family permease
VGSLSTNTQNKSVICFAAGILSIMAFVIMIMNHHYAIMSLLFLSIAQSSLFTILLALIAIHTPIESVGIAFGLFEVLSGISNISGNIAFGYLCSIGDNCIFGLLFSLSLSVIGCCILSAFACTEMLTMPYNPVNQRYQQI